MELVFESSRFQKKVPDHVLIYWNMHSRAPLESLPLEKTLHIRFLPCHCTVPYLGTYLILLSPANSNLKFEKNISISLALCIRGFFKMFLK